MSLSPAVAKVSSIAHKLASTALRCGLTPRIWTPPKAQEADRIGGVRYDGSRSLGTIALLSVLGVLKSSVPITYTYQVFGVCASAVFIASGIGVALFGLGLHRVAAQLGGLALLFFLITFNWIAFGPGDRKFTTKTSSSFSKVVVRPATELEGRLVFGVVALLMDSILIYGLVKGHRNKT